MTDERAEDGGPVLREDLAVDGGDVAVVDADGADDAPEMGTAARRRRRSSG